MSKTSDDAYVRNSNIALSRITADIREAFDFIDDDVERLKLVQLADEYQRHKCNDKCTTVENKCRYGCPFPLQDWQSFVQLKTAVPADIKPILVDCGLGVINEDDDEIALCRALSGGKHLPVRGYGNGNTSSLCGHLFDVTRSHCNTQVSGRFV